MSNWIWVSDHYYYPHYSTDEVAQGQNQEMGRQAVNTASPLTECSPSIPIFSAISPKPPGVMPQPPSAGACFQSPK